MTRESEPITPALLREWDLPAAGGSKHSRGHVVIIGGARVTPGAALLAGIAALRAGAGVLAMAVPDDVAVPLAVAVPEAMVAGWGPDGDASAIRWDVIDRLVEQANAVVVGPGLDDPEIAAALVGRVAQAETSCPVLLDAYALGAIAEKKKAFAALAGRVVLTPNHDEGEMLLEGAGDRSDGAGGSDESESIAARIAQSRNAVVSCDGVVAAPREQTRSVAAGHSGLGTSGSGDVLAGAIGGFLARGTAPYQATCWGTYLHSAAGDRLAARVGRLGFLARELLDELPQVLTELNA